MVLQSKQLLITGAVGDLEVLVETPPKDSADQPKALLVIAHPHPLYNGTMQNKVVHTIARAGVNMGVISVRFNFRGVGASQGVHDSGAGEQQDLIAVVDWAQQRYPELPLWIGGFSFGSRVALLQANKLNAERLLLVAPPVNMYPDMGVIERIDSSALIVMGEEDEVVPFAQVESWVESLSKKQNRVKFIPIKGATHFFHGKLVELRNYIELW
ncbi:MAG: alpha/beta hydrolase [Thiotrichales bacterium]|jgi:hypothetical protein|nr:alpha/beta hydrolase [Thiotrichales bacterium]MBT3614210.1 alpha/beta hydrolase [Thiotrichales bacterium]MBT3752028.1 alpha/beta hydrolase [Thiotrichales bacterium]MBT3837411.1 alpha/beta hydrolase [Thiotrichales bacterium]MBT4152696.1 alpha/beta hydrolase [Thiotrichales bacterium]